MSGGRRVTHHVVSNLGKRQGAEKHINIRDSAISDGTGCDRWTNPVVPLSQECLQGRLPTGLPGGVGRI